MRGLQLILPGLLAVLLLAAPTVGALRAVPAIAQEVEPLPAAECNEVRTALEDGLPVGPGFDGWNSNFRPIKWVSKAAFAAC